MPQRVGLYTGAAAPSGNNGSETHGDFQVRILSDEFSWGSIVDAELDLIADPVACKDLNKIFENAASSFIKDCEDSSAMLWRVSKVFGPLEDHRPRPRRARSNSDIAVA